ncbi:interferon-induced protein 44-like isoform X2 [Mercenaria mercenaria]|nr:interferon-induced protein 44-like isoform X2 [Mercenaria mercenaria]
MMGVEESVRILCVGRTNTGKSSFIDSVMSALSGEISCWATAGYTQSKNEERVGIPDTKKYIPYQLKVSANGNETQKTNVYLCDMPGIHETNGVQFNQIKCVIEGHVPSRYKVLSGINEESPEYVKKPGNRDKIHCVCLFFDGNDVSGREMKCIQELKNLLQDNDIPLIAVVTKIDLLGVELKAGCPSPYGDQRLTNSIVDIAEKYGFRRNTVYPVRNYVHECTVNGTMDALLLAVFIEMLKLAIETKRNLDADGTAVDLPNV